MLVRMKLVPEVKTTHSLWHELKTLLVNKYGVTYPTECGLLLTDSVEECSIVETGERCHMRVCNVE